MQQDLRLGQVGGLGGEIGVADARFGGRFIGQFRLRQVDGVGELILASSDGGLSAAERGSPKLPGPQTAAWAVDCVAILDVAPMPTDRGLYDGIGARQTIDRR